MMKSLAEISLNSIKIKFCLADNNKTYVVFICDYCGSLTISIEGDKFLQYLKDVRKDSENGFYYDQYYNNYILTHDNFKVTLSQKDYEVIKAKFSTYNSFVISNE